jgi:hypothetical protein
MKFEGIRPLCRFNPVFAGLPKLAPAGEDLISAMHKTIAESKGAASNPFEKVPLQTF